VQLTVLGDAFSDVGNIGTNHCPEVFFRAKHTLTRITSVVVSWARVWLLLLSSHRDECEYRTHYRKDQSGPFATFIIAGALFISNFASQSLL
jgi:purine-cytosine permease-like protein